MDINFITKDLLPVGESDKKIPKVKSGDVVKVFSESGEGGQQVFEGVVISVSGKGFDKNMIVRKVAAGVGVEKTYPLYAPTIKKIRIKKSSKVRRAKLYWLRDRVGRSARLAEKDLDPEVVKLMAAEEKLSEVDKAEIKKNKAEVKKGQKGEAKKSNPPTGGKKKLSKAEPEKEKADSKDKS